ncbi:MAG: DUF1634 domain-containing protein [Prevotellaceae bacterium]|jgi:uncharacterized membrane protein|nr:DUF1634 domain-containing protein [Prevotellaceae bacterium]
MQQATEQKTGRLIGQALRIGVIIACAITVCGGILYLIQHHGVSVDYTEFAGDSFLYSVQTFLPALMRGDGAAIIQLGIIVLVATPIMRVALAMISFLVAKDYLYVIITLTVLIIILLNLFFI